MKRIIFLLLLLAIGYMSCTSPRDVTRVDESKQVDFSGRWNDTDSRLVSQEMVKDGLSRIWLMDFVEEKGRKPVIIVGIVKNKTSEHISAETFISDIEKEFINSGKVKLVQGGQAREELRNERADQQDFASPATIKKWGQEKGADFILQGTINSISDSNNKQKLIFYQVDLSLTDLETNEKVWVGDKKIKKIIK